MLVQQESLANYFHKCLHDSLSKHNVQASDHTIVYLENLLHSYARSENFCDKTEGKSPHRALAHYYSDAVNSRNSYQRDLVLRRLGDVALFICGLFSDSLNKKIIDVDYYIAMGGTAYNCLSQSNSIHRTNCTLNEVFAELSKKFVDFMDVLSDLNNNHSETNKNILRTYEVWLKTGSKYAKSILVENGIQPYANSASIKIQ